MSQKQPDQIENHAAQTVALQDELKTYGYAPGWYFGGACVGCGLPMEQVDKRAWRCLDCATLEHEKRVKEARIVRQNLTGASQ